MPLHAGIVRADQVVREFFQRLSAVCGIVIVVGYCLGIAVTRIEKLAATAFINLYPLIGDDALRAERRSYWGVVVPWQHTITGHGFLNRIGMIYCKHFASLRLCG